MHELLQAELIRIEGLPSQIKPGRAVFLGTYRVFPIEIGNIVSSGKPNHRNIELADKVHDIATKTFLVCCRVIGFVNTPIDRSTKLFNERTKQPGVDRPSDKLLAGMYRTLHVAAPL
ncbi:hypothetical protein SDC9_173926 [bioreactor metagenome]|uniref:Uncharacterized protein n=1 Tax=bioreactor metagenome TaxID=1076179 RepID=A0A645GHQ4_9ZZZZ